MADLIDRLAFNEVVTGRPKIAVHQFVGSLGLYAAGKVTRLEISQEWDLIGDELTQAVSLADAIDLKIGAGEKSLYVLTIQGVAMLLEIGEDTIYHLTPTSIDKTRVQSDLEI